MNIQQLYIENERRKKALQAPYNPLTGEGCHGTRFPLHTTETGTLRLPVSMQAHPDIQALSKAGSFEPLAKQENITIEDALLAFSELRMNHDFEYFAVAAETITDKLTGAITPFTLNRGQRKLLAALEDMRLNEYPIRIILLKARQWGGSTLSQLYMYWVQTRLKTGWNSVICAHTMDAAKHIRAMYKLCTDNMPPAEGKQYSLIPFEGTLNIKQVPQRNCRITVGSAVEPDSVRSQDIKMAHFSEVAHYPKTENTNARQLVSSIVSSVPTVPGTLIIYESTANGVGDFFHIEFTKAFAGLSPFRAVFVSWFETGDLYTTPFNGEYHDHTGRKIKGAPDDFIKGMTDYEQNLFHNHKTLTLEHLNWYRYMKSQLGDDMQVQYPSDHIEAFRNSGENVFRADHIEALRDGCNRPPIAAGTITADGDAATAQITGTPKRAMTQNVRFTPDPEALETYLQTGDPKTKEKKLDGKLIIWKHPDRDTPCLRRYIAIYDPQRGVTDKADWGVITVIDRYWRMFGGKSEVVAEWRGHLDKDIAVWTAVQIAIYYNNALLIIESNTFDSEYRKEDGTEFIFETIATHYRNLYSRTEPDKLKEGLPLRYGFHTNRNTKPAIIADYTSTLRERAYIERSHRTLDQARTYERKKDGTYGAKDGHHDDDLITRMIALFVDYHEYPLPILQEDSPATGTLTFTPVNESSF
jgi:hypothetical protein